MSATDMVVLNVTVSRREREWINIIAAQNEITQQEVLRTLIRWQVNAFQARRCPVD